MKPTVDIIRVLAKNFNITFDDPEQVQRLADPAPVSNLTDQSKQTAFIEQLVILLEPMIHGILRRLLTRFTFGEPIEKEVLSHESKCYSRLIASQLWGISQCQCFDHIQRMGVIGRFEDEYILNSWYQRHDQYHQLASWNHAIRSLDSFLAMAISNEGTFKRVIGVPIEKEFHTTSKFFKRRALNRGVAEGMLAWQVASEDGVRLRRVPLLSCQECRSPLNLKNQCSCKGPPKETAVASHFVRDEELMEYKVYRCDKCKIQVYPVSITELCCGICSTQLSGRSSITFPQKFSAALTINNNPRRNLDETDESLADAELVECGAAGEAGSHLLNTGFDRPTPTSARCPALSAQGDEEDETGPAIASASDMELAARIIENFSEFERVARIRLYDVDADILQEILDSIRARFEILAAPQDPPIDFEIYKGIALKVQRNRKLFGQVQQILSAWIADLPEGGQLA